MSMDLMVRAMQTKVGNPLRKLVLIKLADNSSDTGECYPSYQHIAEQCEIAKSTVREHISALVNIGLVSIEHRTGPKGHQSNMYRLHLCRQAAQPTDKRPMPGDGTPYAASRHQNQSLNQPLDHHHLPPRSQNNRRWRNIFAMRQTGQLHPGKSGRPDKSMQPPSAEK